MSFLSPLSLLSLCHTRHLISLSSMSPCHSCHTDTLPSLSPLSLRRPCNSVTPVNLSPLSPCHLVTLSRIFAISWLLYRLFYRMICRSNRDFLHFELPSSNNLPPITLSSLSPCHFFHSFTPVTLSFCHSCHPVTTSLPAFLELSDKTFENYFINPCCRFVRHKLREGT